MGRPLAHLVAAPHTCEVIGIEVHDGERAKGEGTARANPADDGENLVHETAGISEDG